VKSHKKGGIAAAPSRYATREESRKVDADATLPNRATENEKSSSAVNRFGGACHVFSESTVKVSAAKVSAAKSPA
jgi:hypothetical protein